MNQMEQRQELHAALWKTAEEVRGSVSSWDFKQYILIMLFYRFISENLVEYINRIERQNPGQEDFDYASISDEMAERGRQSMLSEKGFFMAPSELFVNVREQAKSNPDLNVTLSSIFKNIEASAQGTPSERDLKGLFDDMDVNSTRLGKTVHERNQRLGKIIHGIGELNFGSYGGLSIDVFGDAYEYLVGMYAQNAGKSGGEFFTPQEVSELLARLTLVGKKEINKVYDPACGSGSLLLQFAKVLSENGQKGEELVRNGFYGQEINLTTYNLCRINMFLHGINFSQFDIAHGDTLTDPHHFDDEPFDAIVSNPPYSIKWEGKDNASLVGDARFTPAGVLAPKSKADLAFVMHVMAWLATGGCAAVVAYPGAMYRLGDEEKIRRYLIENNFVDTVIQLPKDLFFGTGIATCVLILKKSKVCEDVLFIDATDEFERNGSKSQLSKANITKILTHFKQRENVEHFCRLVSRQEIVDSETNLSPRLYITPKESAAEVIDIAAVNAQIAKNVARQHELRQQIDAIMAAFVSDETTLSHTPVLHINHDEAA